MVQKKNVNDILFDLYLILAKFHQMLQAKFVKKLIYENLHCYFFTSSIKNQCTGI
jgi:hypothetical protein